MKTCGDESTWIVEAINMSLRSKSEKNYSFGKGLGVKIQNIISFPRRIDSTFDLLKRMTLNLN